jgi:hypothetical protein
MCGLVYQEPCQECLLDFLLLNLEVEDLAYDATSRPDHVVLSGDELVGIAIGAVVRVRVPDVVAVGAIFGQDRLLDQVLQGRGLVNPD